jgi:hypothetical protein
VHTQEIQVARGRDAVSEIRLRLFVFPEVLDVLATSKLNSLVVVVGGRPRPAEWSGHLRAAGYEILGPRPRRSVGTPASRLMPAPRPVSLRPVGVRETEGERRPLAGRRRRSATAHVTALPSESATRSWPQAASGGE